MESIARTGLLLRVKRRGAALLPPHAELITGWSRVSASLLDQCPKCPLARMGPIQEYRGTVARGDNFAAESLEGPYGRGALGGNIAKIYFSETRLLHECAGARAPPPAPSPRFPAAGQAAFREIAALRGDHAARARRVFEPRRSSVFAADRIQ